MCVACVRCFIFKCILQVIDMISIESLLSEVSTILGSRLTIKAADQAFFGQKQIYTNIPISTLPSVSTRDNKEKQKDVDKLKSAIQNAKDIASNALAGQKPSCASSEVFAEIAALKKENAAIREELIQLRKLIEQMNICETKFRFGEARSVLILGDGNLSFSLSLSRIWPNISITATVLENETDFLHRYYVYETIQQLLKHPNVELIFGVNATALPSSWLGKFDVIIMNFPHPGNKTNLRNSRLLTTGIFHSVRTIMNGNTEFHLSLASGQAGFKSPGGSVWSNLKPGHVKDSWQAIYLAAEEGLVLTRVYPFYSHLFPGYTSAGYKSTNKGFNNWKEAQHMVFKRVCNDLSLSTLRLMDLNRFGYHTLRPFYQHDISFLYTDSNISDVEKELYNIIKTLCGGCIVEIKEIEHLRSVYREPNLPNRIYRLVWQTVSVPIGKRHCNKLQEELRSQICSEIIARNLPLILT